MSLKDRIPGPLRPAAKALRNAALWPADVVARRQDPLFPPRRLRGLVGDGDYHAAAEEFRAHFVDLGGLGRAARVLDVGCGTGRMAARLTRYLEPPGTYHGIDVMVPAIEWAQREISSRYANFQFQVADLQSDMYNPGGAIRAEDYRFPYADDSFDFIFLTSDFTHLTAAEIRNYLAECRRLLAAGGACFATWFISDQPDGDPARAHRSFPFPVDEYFVEREDNHRAAVAYR